MQEEKSTLISEGLIIGYISILGYLVAFAYQYGYFKFFNIPSSFIQLDLPVILISFSAITSVLFFSFCIFQLFSIMGIFNLKGAFGASIGRCAILLITLITYLSISNFKNALVIIITFLIFLFLELLLPFLTQRKFSSTEEKFQRQAEVEKNTKKNDAIFNFINNYRKIGIYLFIGFIIISLADFKGESDAQNQTNFLVPDSKDSIIVVRSYQNSHIGVGYDPNTHQTKNQFMILTNEQLGVLRLIKIGQLKPREIK